MWGRAGPAGENPAALFHFRKRDYKAGKGVAKCYKIN